MLFTFHYLKLFYFHDAPSHLLFFNSLFLFYLFGLFFLLGGGGGGEREQG